MIRALEPADIEASARLLVRSWARAYSDIVSLDQQPTVTEQAEHLRSPDSLGWVFDLHGQIAAVALVRGVSTDDPELSVLHVDPPAQGSGVGSSLHAAVIDGLRQRGHERCHLWVFEANEHARAFYETCGWSIASEPVQPPARCEAAAALRMTIRL